MKSVFIINSEIYAKYQKYAYFMNWFEDHKDVSLCIWNKYVSVNADIDELVPQLFDTVKSLAEWNAYIIDEPFVSGDYIEKDFEKLTQCSLNPYERAGHSEDYDPEKDPLMRLAYYLGGRGVEELEYLKNYVFRAVRPTQIFLLTPRIFEDLDMQKLFLQTEIEEKKRKLTECANPMLTRSESQMFEYSDFWSRYDYPPNCRFLVFDMPDPSSVTHEDSWFLFWMAVMTVAINTYSSYELGAYKLYRLGIDISSDEFSDFLNKFFTALNGACDATGKEIENTVAAIKASKEDTTSNHPGECSRVEVNFPDTDFSGFELDHDLFGKTKDRPRRDTDVWNEHKRFFSVQTHRLFKAVTRGKNEAVDDMNRTFEADMPLLKNRMLSRYDIEDITDSLNASELEMLGMKTGRTASRAVFEKKHRASVRKVEKAMRPRILSSTFFKLMGMGAAICLMGFIPFMISSASFSTTSFMISLLITLGSAGIVALASYIALVVRRNYFGNHLSNYSKETRANVRSVTENAKVQSDYLTALLNYMEKTQMLKFGRIDERQMQLLDELSCVRGAYEDALGQCKAIAGLCRVELNEDFDDCSDNMIFTPGKKIYLHDDTESMLIALNDEPERLTPPFPFIEALQISEEALYESSEYYSTDSMKGARE